MMSPTEWVNKRNRTFALSLWTVIIVEIGLWYWGIEEWVRLVLPVLWLGVVIHLSATAVSLDVMEISARLSDNEDDGDEY